jgi:hypothetical protein
VNGYGPAVSKAIAWQERQERIEAAREEQEARQRSYTLTEAAITNAWQRAVDRGEDINPLSQGAGVLGRAHAAVLADGSDALDAQVARIHGRAQREAGTAPARLYGDMDGVYALPARRSVTIDEFYGNRYAVRRAQREREAAKTPTERRIEAQERELKSLRAQVAELRDLRGRVAVAEHNIDRAGWAPPPPSAAMQRDLDRLSGRSSGGSDRPLSLR